MRVNAASKAGIWDLGAARKCPQDARLSFRFIRKFVQYKGNSVLLLRDRKDTGTLHVTINDERSDGKWRKSRELFSLEVNHQWIMCWQSCQEYRRAMLRK